MTSETELERRSLPDGVFGMVPGSNTTTLRGRMSTSATTSCLMETAADEGWPLYIADIDADLTTSNGRLIARMLAAISEDERDRIRERTKAALAAKKAAGVRLGRPSTLPAEVVARIVTDRASGVSFGKIAAALNADGVPTAQGGKRWYPATVKAVVSGQDAARMRAEK